MILSFKCADTEALANGKRIKRFVNIETVVRRKLRQLQIAGRLEDLRIPPGNRLEALKGARAGQYSIRVNDRFRVCFRWTNAGPADVEIVDMENREKLLKASLEDVKGAYDYIFVDCPPSLNLLTINALVASNSILIPVQCEYYAMEGLGQLLHTFKMVRSNLNPALEIQGVLLTMFDGRNNLAHQVAQEVKNYFSDKVFQTAIPRNIKLSECPSHGKPVILYDIGSKGAESYLELTKEILYS